MRRIIKRDWKNNHQWFYIEVHRKNKDPYFKTYIKFIDETEVQELTYELNAEKMKYYTGGIA